LEENEEYLGLVCPYEQKKIDRWKKGDIALAYISADSTAVA